MKMTLRRKYLQNNLTTLPSLLFPAKMQSNALASLVPLLRAQQAAAKISVGQVRTSGSKIGSVFIFNVDARADADLVSELLRRAAQPEDSLLQFRRVEGENFGLAEFRTASAAYRVCRALTGLPFAGTLLFAQLDRRTAGLAEQWKYLRGREIHAAHPKADANLLDLAEAELLAQITRARPGLVEFARSAELRLAGAQIGSSALERIKRAERDRISEALVKSAEQQNNIEAAKKALADLSKQVRSAEAQLDANDRELERREMLFQPTKSRKHGGLSLFGLRSLLPQDREALFAEAIDWEYITTRRSGKLPPLATSLRAWLSRRIRDHLGGPDRELTDYIMRRTLGAHVDPMELALDLKQYLDDDAEPLVESLWRIFAIETLRRKHCPLLEENILD